MEIIHHSDVKTIEKKLGTRTSYYLFDEYELNVNVMPPHSTQDWHYHKIKEEVVLIIKGSLDVEWKENEKNLTEKLSEGDMVRVEKTHHCFVNPYDDFCTFICLKLVLSGKSKRDILADDKYRE